MGYRIVYAEAEPKKRVRPATAVRLRTLVAAVLLLFSIMVRLLWPDGTTILRSVFLPGNLSVTEVAFSEFVEDIRDGQSLEDSVTVFCRKIIHETP